jgi:hypothetical protein
MMFPDLRLFEGFSMALVNNQMEKKTSESLFGVPGHLRIWKNHLTIFRNGGGHVVLLCIKYNDFWRKWDDIYYHILRVRLQNQVPPHLLIVFPNQQPAFWGYAVDLMFDKKQSRHHWRIPCHVFPWTVWLPLTSRTLMTIQNHKPKTWTPATKDMGIYRYIYYMILLQWA